MDRSKFSNVKDIPSLNSSFLIECSWEVCNQLGGIYTVIRSKIPEYSRQWGDNYCLIGPLVGQNIRAEIDEIHDDASPISTAVSNLRKAGLTIIHGTWLVTGRPTVILIDIKSSLDKIDEIRKTYYEEHQLIIQEDELQKQVMAFADATTITIKEINSALKERNVIAHFHEWMASLPILNLKKSDSKIATVFTTHATALGRYVAMNEESFYSQLSSFDWQAEADKYNIRPIAFIERLCANAAHSFTTVSELTARECKTFYDCEPDVITPNGLNIKRFVASHEVQNLHQEFKNEINEFILGHFFHSTPFDLNNTLYFFTSGRYEFKNKGYDITLKALEKLNDRLKKEGSEITVVMFFITKRPTWSINPIVLQQRGVMEEIRSVCQSIQEQAGSRLFLSAASEDEDYRLPDLNNLVDDYWKLRYRRTLQSWKSEQWPLVVTHNMKDDDSDEIIQFIRNAPLVNSPKDKVKVVYHPDFIDSANPLFGIDYNDFVRGCHLGIFPSYYEPWGYTPLECLAQGVPAITSDFAGFGDFTGSNFLGHELSGAYLLRRSKIKPELLVKELSDMMYNFTQMSRRERIVLRNKAEDLAEHFDWSQLSHYYNEAYVKAVE